MGWTQCWRKKRSNDKIPGDYRLTARGTAAEGILLKILLQNGIEAEHGSPSRPGDIIVLPDVIIEIKDPNANSFSFRDHAAEGETQ